MYAAAGGEGGRQANRMGGRERGGYLNSVARFDIPPIAFSSMDEHGLDGWTWAGDAGLEYIQSDSRDKLNKSKSWQSMDGIQDNINNNCDTGH